ncbi:MAG: VWA-like domain-containing protein [Lachnospiraceae bacterium]|nr:VWA-like domain-containing protein [Lachnospiraceae bacterium]
MKSDMKHPAGCMIKGHEADDEKLYMTGGAAKETAMAVDKSLLAERLKDIRSNLIRKAPFFGHILMHLKLSFAKCGTAATNMKSLFIDPEFAARLSDSELDFVIRHEILHCVLQHCIHRGERIPYFWNLACDIVVNSNLFYSMDITSMKIDGEEVIHLTPKGEAGYLYTAFEVYDMIADENKNVIKAVGNFIARMEERYNVHIDEHGVWETIAADAAVESKWKQYLEEAIKAAAGTGNIPMGPLELLDYLNYKSKMDWRKVLQDFVKVSMDRYDFSFIPPDRRSFGDFILPAWNECNDDYGDVEDLWFVVDTSGSVDINARSIAMAEIRAAIRQFNHLRALISFFDTSITDPVPFESADQLSNVRVLGGGGTSFIKIFEYLQEKMSDKPPVCIIIMTDGYDRFPEEKEALGIPVLWILVNTDRDAPWGMSVHIDDK